MNRKGFTLPIIFLGIISLILAVILGMSVGTIIYNKLYTPKIADTNIQPKVMPTENNKFDLPTDWASYSSISSGIHFQHPNDWNLNDCTDTFSLLDYSNKAECFKSEDYKEDVGYLGVQDSLLHPTIGSIFVVSIYKNIIPDEEREEFNKNPCAIESIESPETSCEVIALDGYSAAKTTEESDTGVYGPANLITIYIGFIKDNDSYTIGLYYPDCEYSDLGIEDCSNKLDNPQLFNNIINTFKIT